MLPSFRKRRSNALTGIVTDDGGTAVAVVKNTAKVDPALVSCRFERRPDDGESPTAIASDDAGLGKGPCSTLLEIGEYQLLVVEAPEVPAQELRAAVRWKIKDLIDFPIDDAVLDVFDAPPGGPSGTRRQMYVVAARRSTVDERVGAMEAAGARLAVIDIPELAMRNLAARLPEDELGLVTLYFDKQCCLIILTHKATLFLTRTVDFRFSNGAERTRAPAEFGHRLALEIQRSLDYYEQHFQKAAIQSIAVIPPPVDLDGLDETLREALGLAIRPIELSDVVDTEEVLDPTSVATCLLAVGCALRAEA